MQFTALLQIFSALLESFFLLYLPLAPSTSWHVVRWDMEFLNEFQERNGYIYVEEKREKFNELESEYTYKTEIDAYVPRRIAPSIPAAIACNGEVDKFAFCSGGSFLSEFRGWDLNYTDRDCAFQICHPRGTIRENSALVLFLGLIYNAAATLSVCHYGYFNRKLRWGILLSMSSMLTQKSY